MRLIDADAFIAAYCKECGSGCDLGEIRCDTVGDLVNAPTIDAVPVVRCKDCQHGEFERENRMWACVRCAEYDEDFDMFTGFIEYHNEDDFCSYGERRSDD